MNTNSVLFILLSIITFSTYGQKSKIADADKNYKDHAYVDAIATYESIAEKGYKDEGMFLKLGNSYYFNANMEKAAKWYGELFVMNKNQEPDVMYRYSQCLKSTGKYKESDEMLEAFNQKSDSDSRAKLFVENRNYLEDINANAGRFSVKEVEINTNNSDYGGTYLGNNFVYTSERGEEKKTNEKVSKWTNRAFTNIYSAEVKPDGSLGSPKPLNRVINSEYNESTPVFTKDNKTMYFTRNNYLNGKKGQDKEKNILLKLYKASFVNGEWKDIKELPFNSNDYSVAHPALSSDDKTLYFASDMSGTKGESDLFRVTIREDGTYSTPENLGDDINTEGRETFPFVSGNNELFFSSDGRPGLGGLDIFVSKIKGELGFGPVKNVSAPINSRYDDFALVYDYKSKKGFLSSNRNGGKGSDDIYKFFLAKKVVKKCKQSLIGSITSKESLEILPNTKVSLFDESFVFLESTISDSYGNYSLDVECGKKYFVRAERTGFDSQEAPVLLPDESGMFLNSFELESRLVEVKVGSDLAKILSASSKTARLNKLNSTNPATKNKNSLGKNDNNNSTYPNYEGSENNPDSDKYADPNNIDPATGKPYNNKKLASTKNKKKSNKKSNDQLNDIDPKTGLPYSDSFNALNDNSKNNPLSSSSTVENGIDPLTGKPYVNGAKSSPNFKGGKPSNMNGSGDIIVIDPVTGKQYSYNSNSKNPNIGSNTPTGINDQNGIDPNTGKPYYNNNSVAGNSSIDTDGRKISPVSSEILMNTDLENSTSDEITNDDDISHILFDTDKSYIRKDQEFQLEKIFVVLSDNPNIKIQVRSHTDCRATTAYNLALSQRRAQATKGWLVKRGINSNRVTAKGYGESELINGCSDGVNCTEEEHQENRRSEFIIISLKY